MRKRGNHKISNFGLVKTIKLTMAACATFLLGGILTNHIVDTYVNRLDNVVEATKNNKDNEVHFEAAFSRDNVKSVVADEAIGEFTSSVDGWLFSIKADVKTANAITEIEIPSTYGETNLPVVGINTSGFQGMTNLEKVILPKTITPDTIVLSISSTSVVQSKVEKSI